MKNIHYTSTGRLLLSLLVIGSLSQLSANPKIEQIIEEVLNRQAKKGDVLNVYLKNARGTYVNGKQISTGILKAVATRSYLKEAKITAEAVVPVGKINEIKESLQQGGILEIQVVERQATETPKKQESKQSVQAPTSENSNLSDYPVNKREAIIEEILNRQEKKGDDLQVYVRDEHRIYVNGKQISLEILQELIPRAKVSSATISSEPHVTQGRVRQMLELVQKSGITKIQLNHPKQY